jgi:peptidoglycan hydrolase CwlO-like protein
MEIIVVAAGAVATGVVGLFFWLIQTAISRYFKRQDVKEEKEDNRHTKVTEQLQELNTNVHTLGMKQLQMLDKVNEGGKLLQEHAKDIAVLKDDVKDLKRTNNLQNR